jgi:hypothetical protein
MKLNDSELFEHHRDDLKPFIPRIIGTRGDLACMVARAEIAAKHVAKHAESAAWSAKFATESAAWYATKCAQYAAMCATSATESTAWYATESAEYAARYAFECAKCAAESTAKILVNCLECLEEMIQVGGESNAHNR